MHRQLIALTAVVTLAVTACGGDDDETTPTAAPASTTAEVAPATTTPPPGAGRADDDDDNDDDDDDDERYRPAVGDTWQWQLTGDLDTSHDVDMYDVDLFDTAAAQIAALHADGRRVVCYFSAGSVEDWRDDAGAFDDADVGEPLDGWDGERWLDIRSTAVLDVMIARLDLAAERRCDGVEPDNVTAYRNDTGFEISADDQIAFGTALADAAHERGLAIGLKNGGELVARLVGVFDFGVNEECHEYDECDLYEPFVAAGKPVFNAEYRSEWADDPAARAELCERARADGLSTVVLPIELDGAFRHEC